MKIQIFILVSILALTSARRGGNGGRGPNGGRGGHGGHGGHGGGSHGFLGDKDLMPLVKACDLTQFCEDPDQAGSFLRPLIVDKSRFSSGNCPQVDENLSNLDIQSGPNNVPCNNTYCDPEQTGVAFCIVCAKKDANRDLIVFNANEVSVDFACEENWMDFGGFGKRHNYCPEPKLVVNPCETVCA